MVQRLAERGRIDVADHRDHQLVAGEHAVDIGLEIVARDSGNRLQRALDRAAIRVALEGEPVPGERGDRFGIVLVEFEAGEDLGADALDRVGIEARLGEGEPRQVEHRVLVDGQRLKIAKHHIARGVEIHAHGEALRPLLEGQCVEVASALIHHRRDEISEPLLALVVLGGAAAKGEAHGDQGIGVTFDEPGFDAARTRDALKFHVASLSRGRGDAEQQSGGEPRSCGRKPRSGRDHDLPLTGAFAGFSPMLPV